MKTKEDRERSDPQWAIYYSIYKQLNGVESDGYGLSPVAWDAATAAMRVIPKFFDRKSY